MRSPCHLLNRLRVCSAWSSCFVASGLSWAANAWATPAFVTHEPLTPVVGGPAGATMRSPSTPGPANAVEIWARVGYSFYWTHAAVYYTSDGSEPQGAYGTAAHGSAMAMSWSHNEAGNIDWIKTVLPAQGGATGSVRYKIGVWHSGGGPEIFANNTGCADGACDQNPQQVSVFSYAGSLAWPGRGHPHPDHSVGYPAVHFWKEEAVAGNNYMNVMLDRNGTIYDVYYPSAGCVQGVGTRNEGYVDGFDTFPPMLPQGSRGQMHLNQVQAGLAVDGVTYWLSNEGGAYNSHAQSYVTDTNVVASTCRLAINGHNIAAQQYDFCPKGITFPNDLGGQPVRGIHIKRFVLTNLGAQPRSITFYCNADLALNGGDGYDAMFADTPRGAMVGYDNTRRFTSASGEYNPTSFSDYDKNVSVYLGLAMKACTGVGSAAGVPAEGSWRDSSLDNNAGWIGHRLTLPPGQPVEVDLAVVGGFDNFAGATGTYANAVAPALDWFHSASMAEAQQATENYWRDWLASGTLIDTPDDAYDAMFRRALLATALHIDAKGGGIIAGMHNGAYPFVWPRDALYAAVTLDCTGHSAEAGEVFRFLREVAYRDNDVWGKGFWYQKYTTDGYVVWNAPQVDETANVPWAALYHYSATGDAAFLNDPANYQMVYQAARAMSEDSSISGDLRFEESVGLMYSNNVWEDSFDTFLYSNAAVERGLRAAASIAKTTGHAADWELFSGRASTIHAGLDGRLDWNGENTDISQLGLVWPFETHSPTDSRMVRVIDRINGVAADRWGNAHPLVNTSGEFAGLIDRYWGDTYWKGGPWFLSTLWYGQYYACRQDHTPGKGDIDTLRQRIDLCRQWLGPAGLGAEQMAPDYSLLYPGQSDFQLQAAWPNAWESMSTIADCLMLFLDHQPEGAHERLYMAPKLPSGWAQMSFTGVRVGPAVIDVTCAESPTQATQTITNRTGGPLSVNTTLRLPPIAAIRSVSLNGSLGAWLHDPAASRVRVTAPLSTGVGSITTLTATYNDMRGDFDHDGDIDADDGMGFKVCATGPDLGPPAAGCRAVDYDADQDVDAVDFGFFQRCYSGPGRAANPACEAAQ